MPIRYFSEGYDFKLKHPLKTTKWIKNAVLKEKGSINSINYIFCSDSYLLKLNQDFLKHQTLTDIITFDYSSLPKSLEAEIYISLDRIEENASKYDTSQEEELHRVIIHGVLHLLGYKDKNKEQKALMRSKEDTYLSLWRQKVPRGTIDEKNGKVPRGTKSN